MTITTDMNTITDTIFDVIRELNGGMSPVFASQVADNVERELLRKMEGNMPGGERIKIQLLLTEQETEFIKEFAEKRGMTKAKAVRTIIDMKMRQEELLRDV